MNPTVIQDAKDIVDMFSDIELPRSCDMATIGRDAATQCAIKHCEGMIKEFSATHIGYGKGIMNAYYKTKTKKWQSLLDYLKQCYELQKQTHRRSY